MAKYKDKEYHRVINSKCRVQLYTERYGSTLDKIDDLVAVAQFDYPTLKRSDIEIVCFGGDRIKGIYGLEFFAPTGSIPASYQEGTLEHIR